LILTGHGTQLRIEAGTLVIRQGFTHHPQKAETYRFFKGDLTLPNLILLLDGSGSLSFEVLSWLGEQGVALARIRWDGTCTVMASGAGFTGDPKRLKWQFEQQASEKNRIAFAQSLIWRKVVNCAETLRDHFKPSERREMAIGKALVAAETLKSRAFTDMQQIRAIEGEAALAYFAAWSELKPRWKSESRYPVPETWKGYHWRSSTATGKKPENRKASHPVNAILNYAYAVRVAQLQIEAVADGFDPFAGIMHHPRRGFPAYAYDLIEPERPKVDAQALTFIRAHTFSGADFILTTEGVCRLSPQLARAVATGWCLRMNVH
jgi:CRISP-associated protein Cas1